MDSVTLDIETRRLADEVGGWGALKRGEGGASAIVLWTSALARPNLYDDNNVEDAVAALEDAPLVLSFNGVGFDIPVLEGLFGRKLHLSYHLDLLQCIWDALADRGSSRGGYSLNDVAFRTLGIEKTGRAVDAPKLADEGRFGELFEYCLSDVILTRDMFKFVQENSGIIDLNGELMPLDMPEWFHEVEI